MKLYTGNGDGGFSSLSSSMKISKSDERFEVLGCIDELVSFIANCRAIVVCPKLNKKLEELAQLLKEGMITKDEYNTKRAEARMNVKSKKK